MVSVKSNGLSISIEYIRFWGVFRHLFKSYHQFFRLKSLKVVQSF